VKAELTAFRSSPLKNELKASAWTKGLRAKQLRTRVARAKGRKAKAECIDFKGKGMGDGYRVEDVPDIANRVIPQIAIIPDLGALAIRV
jgi:hypothetical protein